MGPCSQTTETRANQRGSCAGISTDQASKKTTYTQAPVRKIAPSTHRVRRIREKLKVTASLYRCGVLGEAAQSRGEDEDDCYRRTPLPWYTQSMTTTIKVSDELRDRLKEQASRVGLTLGAHLAHLADAEDRRSRLNLLKAAIAQSAPADAESHAAESADWERAELADAAS